MPWAQAKEKLALERIHLHKTERDHPCEVWQWTSQLVVFQMASVDRQNRSKEMTNRYSFLLLVLLILTEVNETTTLTALQVL